MTEKSDTEDTGWRWFNACQEVDDFLFGELGGDFPVGSENPAENTIEAIKMYAIKERSK